MMNWSDIHRRGSDVRSDPQSAVIAVNVPSVDALLADLEASFKTDPVPAQNAPPTGITVATLNLDHVVKIHKDPAFRAAYARHSHITADGNPIVWLSRLAGHKAKLIPGSELVEPIAARAATSGVPVAFFGATQDTLDKAADTLETRYPGLRVVARLSPPMGFDPQGAAAQEYIEQLAASGARLCFLALGAPKQEIFAITAHEKLGYMSFLSIGAGLDFIAGTQTRAPEWAQKLAVEWVWRLLNSPRRLARRYGACIAILPRLTMAAMRMRKTDQGRT